MYKRILFDVNDKSADKLEKKIFFLLKSYTSHIISVVAQSFISLWPPFIRYGLQAAIYGKQWVAEYGGSEVLVKWRWDKARKNDGVDVSH